MALCDDVIVEIYSWLLAKAVYKFKFVSKFFSIFSTKKYFALKQAQNSFLKDDSGFFLQPTIAQRYNATTEFHPLPAESLSSGVPGNFWEFLENSARIISSSNGLVLCRSTKTSELFICNPVTQSWQPIPTPDYLQTTPYAEVHIVFKCNPVSLDSNDYKIFLFEPPNDWSSYYNIKVYSSDESMWKTTKTRFFTGSRSLRFDMHVLHNGALHFISDSFPFLSKMNPYFRPYIMAYNLEDGESRMLNLPKDARKGSEDLSCQMGIYKWRKITSSIQSICLVRLKKSVFTVWILTHYESNPWSKILKIRVKSMGLKEQDPIVTGFVVINGNYLLFATKKKVYGYGLAHENFMILEEICEHGFDESPVCFISYLDTLRPCERTVI